MIPQRSNLGSLFLAGLLPCAVALAATGTAGASRSESGWGLPRSIRWISDGPAVWPAPADGEEWLSVKDPTIVQHEGVWHLFGTVRGTRRSHAIFYASFTDWAHANSAERRILTCHPGFFCAPQVFYFRPQQCWYLICQASVNTWSPPYQPAFSTTTNLADASSWRPLRPMFDGAANTPKAWLDFWVIGDGQKLHLFYTSLDGKMWRCETNIERFPFGWSNPVLALEGDIFEASHTYRLRGSNGYLTLIEAQNGHGWRYYKAYLADRLEGPWRPWHAEREDAFASLLNVDQAARWTDCISHGELIRAANDESLEIDPRHLQFLVQGVLDRDREGKPYGAIPWRLGLLKLSPAE